MYISYTYTSLQRGLDCVYLKREIDNFYEYFESIVPHVILVISRKYVYNRRVLFYVNLYSIEDLML